LVPGLLEACRGHVPLQQQPGN